MTNGNAEIGRNEVQLEGFASNDKSGIANEFGNFFSNIGIKVQNSVKNRCQQVQEYIICDNRGESFELAFDPCTSDELLKIIKSLKSNSAGVDGLSLRAFKAIMHYILPCLLFIINLSLEKGIFPDQLKVAKVIPLHKGGPKKEIENWRPISILPLFSKLLEKVVHKRLYSFLQANDLLSETQFGFRKGHSTTNALQQLIESINSGMDRGETPLSIFIDIRKAFDTVDFQTLLSRMESLGVRGKCLKWFESYLTGRSLKVVLNDVGSAAFPVTCGVPQGSVLGPLLYLIYVDLMRLYLKDVCLTSFADDTVLTVFASSVKDLVRKANLALERLEIFTSLSLLCVNVRKTFLMTFCRVGTPLDVSGQVTLCGNLVQQVDHLRYLGFYLDCHLAWKCHSDAISSKIARGVGILRRLQHFLPQRILLTIYYSLVYPYISYGCLLWSSNFLCNYRRVQVLQNKAVRTIGRYVQDVHDTCACFRSLKLLNVGQIRDYQAAVFVFQCKNGLTPDVFKNFYQINSDLHNYGTRQSDNIVVDLRRGTRSSFSMKHLGPSVWNELPLIIRAAEHVPQFKKNLKDYFLGGIC